MMLESLLRLATGFMISLNIVYKCIAVSDQNLALGNQCLQSSTHETRYALRATNGIKTQNLTSCQGKCCTHTQFNSVSWWAVDLGDVYEIRNVVIFGRTDCCQDRLSKFFIEAIEPQSLQVCSEFSLGDWSNFDQGEVSECHFEENTTEYLNASCKPGTMGQFLRLRLTEKQPLTLCEVEVYGYYAGPLYLGRDTEHKCGFLGNYYQGNPLLQSHSESVIECVLMCLVRGSCFAANYKASGKECDLMEKLPGGYSQYLVAIPAWRVHFNP